MTDFPVAKKPRLFGEDFTRLKENLRERKKKLALIPRIRLLNIGHNASLSQNISHKIRNPIFLSDIQNLLLYSMIGNQAPYIPNWCKLDKYNNITHTVVLVIEGLSIDHYVFNESIFKHISSKLDFKLELKTPATFGGSIIDELATVPLSVTQSNCLKKKFGSLDLAAEKTHDLIRIFKTIFPVKLASEKIKTRQSQLPLSDKFSRTDLILSPTQLLDNEYPLPLNEKKSKEYIDYVFTKDEYTEVHPKSKMFGIDCEMCKTTLGILELTRISIVDEQLHTVYDTLVKPDNQIIDYLTRFSGITKNMMNNVTTNLKEVQKFITNFLPSDAILVGQSLNSDLHALKMMHPYIIDTSVIFNLTGDRFRKTKLKVLAQEFLNELIQEGKKGHCSTEDSLAVMKLVKLKLANNLCFGDLVLIEQFHFQNRNKKLNKDEIQQCILGSPIFNYFETLNSKTSAIYGCSSIINDYSKIFYNSTLNIMKDKDFKKGDNLRLFISEDNKELVTRCSEIAMEHALNFCHLKLNDEQLSENNLLKTLSSVDKWAKRLWKHTNLHGLICIIFSGKINSTNGICFLNIKKIIQKYLMS